MDETLNPQTDVERTTQSNVSRMTDEEKRIRIAELCDWEHIGPDGRHMPPYLYGTRGVRRERIPDYLNDLNAMHAAEKMLWEHANPFLKELYADNLERIMLENTMDCYMWYCTARQRADAFLLTLGEPRSASSNPERGSSHAGSVSQPK